MFYNNAAPSFAFAFTLLISSSSFAQSILDRLSGFDQSRVHTASQWAENVEDAGMGAEAAKLVYQVNRFARGGVLTKGRTGDIGSNAITGEIVSFNGKATKIDRWRLPVDLASTLEFNDLFRVEITASHDDDKWIVITSVVPNAWLRSQKDPDFQTAVTGVLARKSDEPLLPVIVAPSVAWLAGSDDDGGKVPAGWAMLGKRGFDVALLEGVRGRNRQPLKEEDAAAFYSLLRTAAMLDEASNVPTAPDPAPAATLLKDSANLVGRYLRLDLQSVRATRIRVTAPITKERLGADNYWQIDAFGDLGNVVIKIESKDAESAIFENRYPVSIAMRDLPPFFANEIAAENRSADINTIDTAMISRSIAVEGFFYRLWSYESDFMNQHGGGKQFGPLVIASRMIDIEAPRTAPTAVSGIGWYVALMTLAGILLATVGAVVSSRRDARMKKKARAGLPDRIIQ